MKHKLTITLTTGATITTKHKTKQDAENHLFQVTTQSDVMSYTVEDL